MVPRLLNDDQKERHMQVCQDIIERFHIQPDLFCRVITGDQTRIFKYDPEMNQQSDVAEAEESKTKFKVIMITFFDARGIVQSEFLPQDQTINQQVYKEIPQRILRSVREKRREM